MKRTKRNDRLAAVRKLGTHALAVARDRATERFEDARAGAIDTVSRLEKAFETRVTRAMSRLGVPTTREVRALAREVASLKSSVQRLARSRARA